MNGCSACIHAAETDPQGKAAASYGAGYWCKQLKKPVETKEGSECQHWKYEDA
ncbi:MAG: hypothetical protein KAS18_02045 [Calditrichia bacterium]|nr:hypothetical protein [Calditrichia bacterium]